MAFVASFLADPLGEGGEDTADDRRRFSGFPHAGVAMPIPFRSVAAPGEGWERVLRGWGVEKGGSSDPRK